MQAPDLNWRPLGELFFEAGLITRDQLEEALSVQAETRQRLGQILVTNGIVTEPELTRVLLDQLGRELEKESSPGSLTHALAPRRDARPALLESSSADDVPVDGANSEDETAEGDPMATTRATFEAALMKERVELEKRLGDQRSALAATLSGDLAPAEPAEALVAPALPLEAPGPATTVVPTVQAEVPAAENRELPPPDVTLLLRKSHEIQDELSIESAVREAAMRETVRALQEKVSELEAALSGERARHAHTAEELDRARGEARQEAVELRAAVNRLRADLSQVDAVTAWFEYWSGSVRASSTPASTPPET